MRIRIASTVAAIQTRNAKVVRTALGPELVFCPRDGIDDGGGDMVSAMTLAKR
jgi:hypothetical protein